MICNFLLLARELIDFLPQCQLLAFVKNFYHFLAAKLLLFPSILWIPSYVLRTYFRRIEIIVVKAHSMYFSFAHIFIYLRFVGISAHKRVKVFPACECHMDRPGFRPKPSVLYFFSYCGKVSVKYTYAQLQWKWFTYRCPDYRILACRTKWKNFSNTGIGNSKNGASVWYLKLYIRLRSMGWEFSMYRTFSEVNSQLSCLVVFFSL